MLTICTISKSYNQELINTLESLSIQIDKNFRLILIISNKNLKKKYSTKINALSDYFMQRKILMKKIIGKDNSIYDAMNIGLKETKTSHILYLNAGDTLSSSLSIKLINKKLLENPHSSHAFSVFNYYKKHIWKRNSKSNKRNLLTALKYTPPHQGYIAYIKKRRIYFDTKIGYNADSKWIKDYLNFDCIFHQEAVSFFKLGGISNSYSFKDVKNKFIKRNISFITKLKILLKFLIFLLFNDRLAYEILHFTKGFKKVNRINDEGIIISM